VGSQQIAHDGALVDEKRVREGAAEMHTHGFMLPSAVLTNCVDFPTGRTLPFMLSGSSDNSWCCGVWVLSWVQS
jgi:hypothetical protein